MVFQQPLIIIESRQTKLMLFRSRQMYSRLDSPCLPFTGRELAPEDTAKDLGVILDTNLALKIYH